MVKTEELKEIMLDKRVTYAAGAERLGVSIQTFNSKMNRKGKFSCEEAQILSDLLGLSNVKRAQIFLN